MSVRQLPLNGRMLLDLSAHGFRLSPEINGVASVDVSLNQARATVKLKPGNNIALANLAQSIREKGYTVPAAEILVTGTLARVQNRWLLRIPTSGETLELAEDNCLSKHVRDTLTLRGKATFAKNRKPGPLVTLELK